MKLAVSTGTLYIYPLRTVFGWARQAGFQGVQVVVNPEAIARGGAGVRRLADEAGLEIVAVHPTVIPLPGWRERYGGMERTIPLARDMRAPVVVMHTPRSAGLDDGEGLAFRQRIERWLPRLVGDGLRMAGGGLCLAIENKTVHSEEDRGYALTPLDRLRAFADRYDLGLVLDTAHAGTAGEDLLQARRVFDGRLVDVHLSDVGGELPALVPDAARQTLDLHRFPGAGELRLAPLLAALQDDGYAGSVTLEVNPFALRFWWPPAIRRRLAQAAAWMRRAANGGQEPTND
ncbi:MAG: sugar phosphate isomerase/epimerase [Anaerolineae bacterium]